MAHETMPKNAADALAAGNIIDAILVVHKEHGLGLADAKAFVERSIAEHPDVSSRMHSANTCPHCSMPLGQCECPPSADTAGTK